MPECDQGERLVILREQALRVRIETLKLHKLAPDVRVASCLSDIEILTVLYYGSILRFDPAKPMSSERDRFIISKGHGGVSIYPILADIGFFDKGWLGSIGQCESKLPTIPDAALAGIETINGSLGHGLGVACGMALALKTKKIDRRVFVLCGDGELNEGAMWEAVMFAGHHRLDNLILIVDDNKKSMLGYQEDILGRTPMADKFEAFGWGAVTVDGHDLGQLYATFRELVDDDGETPTAVIAETRKGNGIERFLDDPICHVKSLTSDEIDRYLEEWQ